MINRDEYSRLIAELVAAEGGQTMTSVCPHYIVERLDDISKKIEEDIKLNPNADIFSDVMVEDLRHEIIFKMGVDAHNAWKKNKKG